MSTNTLPNLEALREVMKRNHVDAVIVPGTDAHQSEYVSPHWKMRDWISGFTGSNGTAVVTSNDARLWTDSRYFLQAAEQLKHSGFTMMKEDVPGEPSIMQWLAETLHEGDVLAVDGSLFSIAKANALEVFCGENGFRFAPDFAPFDQIWTDRPLRPQGKLFVHDDKYAGESVSSKISRIMDAVHAQGADCILLPALDEIAWTFNIRCDDVAFTPVAISFAFLSDNKRVLFIDDTKLTDSVRKHLADADVDVMPYESVAKFLASLKNYEAILLDPTLVNDTLGQAATIAKIYAKSPVIAIKAIKNDTQIKGTREAMKRDGVALVRTFMWIESMLKAGKSIDETDVWEKGKEMRGMSDLYRGDSFGMIAGYKDHGAIVHYNATEESKYTLAPEGLLLVDSGAQYLDGTTDITRTVSLGKPTADEIHDYTLVLKGHIALARQIFPEGTRGAQLDALARHFLWNEGKTFLHGVGHGVGHFLGVHEGPQNIRLNENPATMVPGMITSDEPGIYIAGKYGIRIENLTLVTEAFENEEFGKFYKFETLTLFPYDSSLIDTAMLSDNEIDWINRYHERVYNTLSPELDENEKSWLKAKTAKLNK